MSTRDLIDALVAGDSVAIDSTFETVMTQKVSAALDDLRVSVATNMFNPQVSMQEEPAAETVTEPIQSEETE